MSFRPDPFAPASTCSPPSESAANQLAGADTETEGYFRALIENALDIIHVADAEGVIRYITPSVEALLGYRPEEMIGRRSREFVHPDELSRGVESFGEDILRAGASRFAEMRIRHKDGSWRTFEVTGRTLPGLSGSPAVVVTSRDVTERRQTEAELHRNEQYLQRLFESAPEGIVLLDDHDRVVRANSEFAQIFRYTPAELEGRPINELIIPASLRDEAEAFSRCAAAGEPFSAETVRRRSDGSLIDVSILGAPVRLAGGQIAVFVIYRDISGRRQMERQHAELLQREREARAQAEAAERRSALLAEVSALLDASLDYHATFRNLARLAVPALADYCLIDEVEDGGEYVRRVALAHVDPEREKLLYRDSRHRLNEDPSRHPVIRVVTSGRPVLVAEVSDTLLDTIAHDSHHRAGLRALGLRSFIIAPLIARGRTLGAITLAAAGSGRQYGAADLAMAEEVARRAALALDNARLYGEAQQAIQAREKVLAFVSHDLRNPLATILLNASGILETLAPEQHEPWLREQLEWIERSTEQMNRLIEDLLDVTRLEAGHLSIDPSPLAVAPLIEQVLAMLHPLAADRAIALRADGIPELPPVLADHGRITQVFSNLIGNALKFTPPGGQVTVGAKGDGDFVRFSVQDTGIGIAEDHLPHLFDRYWQARRTIRGGSGLGLGIAHGIVEAHGGRIWVNSELEQGSTFFFTLPAAGG